jgi:hypothetical protein
VSWFQSLWTQNLYLTLGKVAKPQTVLATLHMAGSAALMLWECLPCLTQCKLSQNFEVDFVCSISDTSWLLNAMPKPQRFTKLQTPSPSRPKPRSLRTTKTLVIAKPTQMQRCNVAKGATRVVKLAAVFPWRSESCFRSRTQYGPSVVEWMFWSVDDVAASRLPLSPSGSHVSCTITRMPACFFFGNCRWAR